MNKPSVTNIEAADRVNLLHCKVHSLSSGKVGATASQNPSHRNFHLLFSKFTSRCTLKRQFWPEVAHKGRNKEKITAIYCLWMVDNERGR